MRLPVRCVGVNVLYDKRGEVLDEKGNDVPVLALNGFLKVQSFSPVYCSKALPQKSA